MTQLTAERDSALLVLDVERLRKEHQNFGRSENGITLSGVVVIKQLESRELHRLRLHVGSIRIVLQPRLTPAVHVDHDLDSRIELDRLCVREHWASESMDDQ